MCTHAITGETVAQRVTALSGPRECGSIGRAVALQAKGSEIETLRFHVFSNHDPSFLLCFRQRLGWSNGEDSVLWPQRSGFDSRSQQNSILFFMLYNGHGSEMVIALGS